ncbi:MAG: hypothetical protein QM503_03840 [Bacteroidota bacterium]
MPSVNIQLPTKYLDLSNKQLLFVAKLFLSEFARLKFSFLTHALVKFGNIKIKKVLTGAYRLKLPKQKPFVITLGKMMSVVDNLEWLLTEITEIHPLKSIWRAKPVNYRLYNTKFVQFLTAENFFMAYNSTKKEEYLNALVATLYQRPGHKFTDSLVKKRARYFRFVSLYKKYTVYLWYSGFRWYVAQECPNMFENESDSGEIQIKEHVMNMIRGLTEGDVTKNKKVTYKTDTWDALYELDAKVKHVNEMKSKLKK